MIDLFASYATTRDLLPDQGSITWVGIAETEALVELLGNPTREISGATMDDVCATAMDLSGEEAIVLVSQHGGWTVLFEPTPFCGSDPRAFQQFSAHSAALNVSWTVNHDVWVTTRPAVKSSPGSIRSTSQLSSRSPEPYGFENFP